MIFMSSKRRGRLGPGPPKLRAPEVRPDKTCKPPSPQSPLGSPLLRALSASIAASPMEIKGPGVDGQAHWVT